MTLIVGQLFQIPILFTKPLHNVTDFFSQLVIVSVFFLKKIMACNMNLAFIQYINHLIHIISINSISSHFSKKGNRLKRSNFPKQFDWYLNPQCLSSEPWLVTVLLFCLKIEDKWHEFPSDSL